MLANFRITEVHRRPAPLSRPGMIVCGVWLLQKKLRMCLFERSQPIHLMMGPTRPGIVGIVHAQRPEYLHVVFATEVDLNLEVVPPIPVDELSAYPLVVESSQLRLVCEGEPRKACGIPDAVDLCAKQRHTARVQEVIDQLTVAARHQSRLDIVLGLGHDHIVTVVVVDDAAFAPASSLPPWVHLATPPVAVVGVPRSSLR